MLTIGDTINSLPGRRIPSAEVLQRVHAERRRLVLVDLEQPSSWPVLDGIADLLERYPRVEFVVTGPLVAGEPARSPARHPRVAVVPS
ncbi:hypothetical protein HBB16_01290 [Pseudonocardia sp. MCCB 268]|nr:hypothetical protein [Pseudonocardia cytotoxica]